MKKYILYLAALMMVLASCSDSEEVDIKYQINVTVDPSTVLTPFHGFRIGGETYGLDMYSDKDGTAELRITSFVYDETGELVEKYETVINDYTSNVKFSFLAKENIKYTIVSISNSIYENGIFLESYTISNENNLSKLSIQQQHYGDSNCSGQSFYSNWSILGLSTQTIDVNQQDYVINLKPITSMVEINYSSIHAWDEHAVDTYVLQYKNNTMVSFDSTTPLYTTGLSNGTVNFSELDVTENPGDATISSIINILPCQGMKYNGLLFIGEEGMYWEGKGTGIIDITSGEEYEINLDCQNREIEAKKLGARNKSILNENIINENIKLGGLTDVALNKSYHDNLIILPQRSEQGITRIVDLLNGKKNIK